MLDIFVVNQGGFPGFADISGLLSVCRTDLSVSDVDILLQLSSAENIRM